MFMATASDASFGGFSFNSIRQPYRDCIAFFRKCVCVCEEAEESSLTFFGLLLFEIPFCIFPMPCLRFLLLIIFVYLSCSYLERARLGFIFRVHLENNT